MSYFFLCFLLSLFVSCKQSKKISEKGVMETFNEFFYLLNNDIDKIRNYLSEEFIEFVKGFGKFESKRNFKNIKISTDLNSVYISLEHTGEFEPETPTPEGVTFLSYEWLESAFLIKENGKLKFKFYFSEQINDRKNNLYRRHPLPINN